MTSQTWEAPRDLNPILAAIHEKTIDLREMKEVIISPRDYRRLENDTGAKVIEVLPNCFKFPKEIWSAEDNRTKVIFILEKRLIETEKQPEVLYRVRAVEVNDLANRKFEEYVFPQKNCGKLLEID